MGHTVEYILQVAIVYVSTRIFNGLNQMYLPLYLQVTLQLPKSSVATIPLVMCLVSFATSTAMKLLNKEIGRKVTFLLGCAIRGAKLPVLGLRLDFVGEVA